mmetsp:Transcript_12209/g.13978  ORF Transcript_12209/g.13978 Transcript_12209/m.13978 type:complete len:88 (-) Transcript_12209:6-269(-)
MPRHDFVNVVPAAAAVGGGVYLEPAMLAKLSNAAASMTAWTAIGRRPPQKTIVGWDNDNENSTNNNNLRTNDANLNNNNNNNHHLYQ